MSKYFVFIVVLICSKNSRAQSDRIARLTQNLNSISEIVPGMNQKVEYAISGGTLIEFLRGMAMTNDLNLNIDPSLTQPITGNFTGEKAKNILIYLAQQYSLDFSFVGSIITIMPYRDPLLNQPAPPKYINLRFDQLSRLLNFDLTEDSLVAVARKITETTHTNIIVMPELYGKKVTFFVQGMALLPALEQMSIANSFKVSINSDSLIRLEILRPDEQIVAANQMRATPNYTIKRVRSQQPIGSGANVVIDQDSLGNKFVSINVSNAPIADVIKSLMNQVGLDYVAYSELLGTVSANIEHITAEHALELVLKESKYTFSKVNGVYMLGERKFEGLRAQRLVQMHYRSVDSVINTIPIALRDGVEITEFKELNGILLSGSGPQIGEIQGFLEQIDKVVPMITLEVILLDINKGRTISTGITAGTSDSVKTGGSLVGSGGLNFTLGSQDINQFINAIGLNNVFNLGHVTPNFYVNLTALENNTNVNQRQTPKLSTLNGHTANLSIGNTQYYAISTQNVLGSLSPQTVVTQQFIPVEANLTIDITPFVAGNDQVTMNIGVNISNFTANTPINQPPPISTSKFKSIIRVKNDEMILLGGIERTTRTNNTSGIPLLSRIPILKWIFGARTKGSSKVVSVVFIKPTISYQ